MLFKQFMDSTFKQYKKNEIIYHMEDIPQAIGIVKEGSVVIETVDFLGNVSLLSHIGFNQMFAESYALTKHLCMYMLERLRIVQFNF